MKELIPIICFILLLGCNNINKQPFTDKYNLGFKLNNNRLMNKWINNTLETCCLLDQDSSIIINGKHPLLVDQAKMGTLRLPLNLRMYQLIVLPDNSADSLLLSVNCRNQKLEGADFIFSALNINEDIVSVDTLSFIDENMWVENKRTISLRDVALINIKVNLYGYSKNDSVRFWIDKIGMKLDGKDINNFLLPVVPKTKIDTLDLVTLSFSEYDKYFDISLLNNKRIVAIGESVHGSKTINKSAIQIIKHQVKNNNCKLIMFELPIEYMLSFNRFIHGDENFKIDEIMEDFKYMYSSSDILDFVYWLKYYNDSTSEKVSLMGIDYTLKSRKGRMFLFDYIFKINQKENMSCLDSICKILLEEPENLIKLSDYIAKSDQVRSILGEKEFQILLNCIKSSYNAGSFLKHRYPKRDSVMYINAKLLLENLCKEDDTAIIYSHIGHSKYKPNINEDIFFSTLGSLMKQEYGKDYSCIGMFIGAGEIISRGSDGIAEIITIINSNKNTFENALSKIGKAYFYNPISKMNSDIIQYRIIGNEYQADNECLMSLSDNLDGVIFINCSKPSETDLYRFEDIDFYGTDKRFKNREKFMMKLNK